MCFCGLREVSEELAHVGMQDYPIKALFPLPEPFASAAGVSQQRDDLPAVFIIANPKSLTIGQFCMGGNEQSCPWPAENLSLRAALRSTPGASIRGIL